MPESLLKPLLFIRVGKRVVPIATRQILWIAGAGNYARVHTTHGEYLARATLSSLVDLLDPSAFARIHKSTIVNLYEVAELRAWFSGEMLVVLKNGAQLKMSRKHRQELEQRLPFL